MRAGLYPPKCVFFGWARLVVFQITNVPVLNSDEVPGGPVPGILPVYSVNRSYTREREQVQGKVAAG